MGTTTKHPNPCRARRPTQQQAMSNMKAPSFAHKGADRQVKEVKKISQETFDESVQDNIDMFDMDREEAIKESIEQFELMKVDITGISTHITAEALMKVGFAELIMNVMKTHAAHEETQRQCCHAIRNAVARDYKKEYVPKFVELGAEGAANNVTRRFPRCGDISRACVRDLGFEYEGSLVGRPAHELMHDAQTPENDGQTMTMDEAFSSLHGNAVQQGIEGMCT